MSEGKKGISELGPIWLTAISTLIVALTGAGFFVGKASAPEVRAAAPTTVTVTASPTETNKATEPVSTSHADAPEGDAAGVAWSGELTWGEYNLDFNPPRVIPGKSIVKVPAESMLLSNDAGKLADWQTDSAPGKDNCLTAVAERGSNQTNSLVPDSYVCGRTPEGRTFRIHILAAGGSEVRSEVTVWAK